MIVGDIHGDMKALDFILGERDRIGCKNILFLGDYVDSGIQGTEVLLRLFQMKIEDPEHVFLLRGNHEDGEMNYFDGFFEEIWYDKEFLIRIHRTYIKMPVAAVLQDILFAYMEELKGSGVLKPLQRKDLIRTYGMTLKRPGFTSSIRGPTVKEFGPDIVNGFLRTNSLKRIVRGHTALKKGYKWWFDRKLLSLFSCPDYVGLKNNGAFALFEKGELKLFVFKKMHE